MFLVWLIKIFFLFHTCYFFVGLTLNFFNECCYLDILYWPEMNVCSFTCSPYIIGTLVQTSSMSTGGPNSVSPASTPSTVTSNNLLQMHHNFRWIIYSNHVEPVAGFLARYLQRRLVAEETRWSTSGFTSTCMMTDGRSGSLGRRLAIDINWTETNLKLAVTDTLNEYVGSPGWLPLLTQYFPLLHCLITPKLFFF